MYSDEKENYPAWNAKKESDKPIPSRFIEYDYEWNRTERFKDWRSFKTLDEWRAKYARVSRDE